MNTSAGIDIIKRKNECTKSIIDIYESINKMSLSLSDIVQNYEVAEKGIVGNAK